VRLIEAPDDQADTTESDDTETAAAATDGGDSPENDDATAAADDSTVETTDGDESEPQTDADVNDSLIEDAIKKIANEHDSGDEITAPAFAGQMGIPGEQGEAVLERLTTEKGKLERLSEGYRVI